MISIKKREDKEIELFKLENNKAPYIPLCRSMLNFRNFYAIELFKGRSYKVGWKSSTEFTTIHNRIIFVTKLETYDPNFNCTDNGQLKQQLYLVYKYSDIETDNNDIKCQVRDTKKLLKEMVSVVSINQKPDIDKYHLNIWKLLKVFWLHDDSDTAKKEKFSYWMEDVLSDSKDNISELDVVNVLKNLTIHNIEKACEIACKLKMPQLSLLIAQINSTKESRLFMKSQIKHWEMMKTRSFIDETVYNIYLLLSGFDFCNFYQENDWLRHLAIYLWYVCPSDLRVHEIINIYSQLLEDAKENGNLLIEYHDLIYLIMLLYTDNKYSLEKLLIPFTHAKDILDYRLSWLLLQTLTSLKIGVISNSKADQIHNNFAIQLENMGLYIWSIFVLLHISDENMKTKQIMDVLYRNISIELDDFENEYILIHNFKIPIEWVEYVKGIKSSLQENTWLSYAHYLHANDFNNAHDTAMSNMPALLLNNNLGEIIKILHPMLLHSKDIEDWNTRGGLIYNFVILQQTFSVYEKSNNNVIRFDFFDKIQEIITDLYQAQIEDRNMAVCASIIYKAYCKMMETLKNYYPFNNMQIEHIL